MCVLVYNLHKNYEISDQDYAKTNILYMEVTSRINISIWM